MLKNIINTKLACGKHTHSTTFFGQSCCSGREFMPVVQQADYAALNGTRQCDMLLLENSGWVWAEDLVCLAPLLIDFSRGMESPLHKFPVAIFETKYWWYELFPPPRFLYK